MNELIKNFKEKKLVSKQQHELLAHNFEGASKHVFADQASDSESGSKHANQYSLETKLFAMTLHYYPPKAYDFVHRSSHVASSIQYMSWTAPVNWEPGFFVISSGYLEAWCKVNLQCIMWI